MSTAAPCCPKFDPAPWDGTTLKWENKLFVKDRVRSFLHIPLNFGAVMTRNMARIRAAGAEAKEQIILSDENSPWGADVYIHVAGGVPGATMAPVSGEFLSKVFEGPFKDVPKWAREMKAFVASKGRTMRRLLFFYTTCPKCAKIYGKNYVALLAEV